MSLNFYPGPSKLYPDIRNWMTEIYNSGILSKNHRSDAFMEMLQATVIELKKKLAVPDDYEVYFTSSATECWEIVIQSLISGNTHFAFNGAFGKKWYQYAQNNSKVYSRKELILSELAFGILDDLIDFLPKSADTICLVHNETSNGTAITDFTLKNTRAAFPQAIIAVDATSSMGGLQLPWKSADCWFASVQKCFGLPPGMAIMVVSPNAIKRAEIINDNTFYNSLLNIRANFQKNQTPYTPNSFGIALLNKLTLFLNPIREIHDNTIERANDFYDFISTSTRFEALVSNRLVCSSTVFALTSKSIGIQQVIEKAASENIIIGKGYGDWKSTSFRIANFPAISDSEFEFLKQFLKQF